MRSFFAVISLFLVLPALSCSGGKDNNDPWATGEGKGAAPKTEGFGQEDFQGPKRRDERGPGPGPGPGMGPEEVPEARTGSDLSGPEDCNDTIDNDGNGKADCDDPGCAGASVCSEEDPTDEDAAADEDDDAGASAASFAAGARMESTARRRLSRTPPAVEYHHPFTPHTVKNHQTM